MKVNTMYIIDCGHKGVSDDESKAVCRGLYAKYSERCQKIAVIQLAKTASGLTPQPDPGQQKDNRGGPDLPKLGQPALKGELVRAESPSKTLRNIGISVASKPEQEAIDSPDNDRRVGIYFVMHAPVSFALKAPKVARIISETLSASEKTSLDYVVLISCMLAPENDMGNGWDEDAPQYIADLMRSFDAHGMRPVVAGWDSFITAGPHIPERCKTLNILDQKTKKILSKITDYHDMSPEDAALATAPLVGRKIISTARNSKYTTMHNAYRELHKHLYRVNGNGDLQVCLGGWSSRSFSETDGKL